MHESKRIQIVLIVAIGLLAFALYAIIGMANAATASTRSCPQLRTVVGTPKAAPASVSGVNLSLAVPTIIFKKSCDGSHEYYWNIMMTNSGNQPIALASPPTPSNAGVRLRITGPANLLSKTSSVTLDGTSLLCTKSNGLLCMLLPDTNPAYSAAVLAPGASVLVQVTLVPIAPDGGKLHATVFIGKQQSKTSDDSLSQVISITRLS